MHKNTLIILGIILFIWLWLGSCLQNRYCNCNNAVSAVATPAVISKDNNTRQISIVDDNPAFSATTKDNLLFESNACDYVSPISEPLTGVYKEAVNHLKSNPNRILVLTGLFKKEETNSCSAETNLGYSRAAKVKDLLISMGAPAEQIRTQSVEKESLETNDNKIVGGVLYEFISGEIKEVEDRLRIGKLTLYFDKNAKNLSLSIDQQKYFEDLKYYLNAKPDAKVDVVGHTDNDKSKAAPNFNEYLGRKRAEFVRDYMANNGINSSQIIPISKGETEPIASNDSEKNKALNRRVEVKVVLDK